jgi:hypothetical protein
VFFVEVSETEDEFFYAFFLEATELDADDVLEGLHVEFLVGADVGAEDIDFG